MPHLFKHCLLNRVKLVSFAAKFLSIAIVLLMASCNRMSDYKNTVRSGIATLPWPKQMEELFGEGDHFITHYGFDSQPKEWNTEVFFWGRYELTLQVDVAIDYPKKVIINPTSPPKFYLKELERIAFFPDGRASVSFAATWQLSEDQWRRVVEAKGDWSVLGISLKTNDPVPGFAAYVQGQREPRVRVK